MTETNSSLHRRVLVGFDLRRVNSRQQSDEEQVVAKIFPNHPASIDPEVWPSLLGEQNGGQTPFGHTNSFNLLVLPDFWGADQSTAQSAAPVAFDLPLSFLGEIGRADHVTQISPDLLGALHGWELLGFDITERYVNYSVIWSPHFDGDDIRTLRTSILGKLNPFGLIPSFDLAAVMARYAEALSELRDHAPFTPCGIWLKAEVADLHVRLRVAEP